MNLGVFSDILIGDCSARFTFDEGVGGALNKIQNFFFKANLLDQWTNATRTAFALMMSHDIALDRGKAWGKLSKERRRIFDMYNIGEAEWDAMRMGEMSAADGRNYFTAGAVDSLPDNVLAEYLTRTGKEVNEYNIAAARIDIGDKVRTMFKDRTDFAVLNPDARTRSWLRHGTSAGTVEGELLRFIMQFKSFSAAYVQKGLGRFVYGMEGDSRAEVLSQFSKYILLTTALGYVAMSAKDLAKGRVPRDPKEPATWQEAFLQGGGAGIFGDFIFGDFNRYGGGLIATLAGPTMADLEELAKMKSLIQEGDSVEQTLTRFVQSHTPGTSIFYLRAALDYFIMWNLYETMKPGYFSRMKQRIKRQNNQDLWLTPAGY